MSGTAKTFTFANMDVTVLFYLATIAHLHVGHGFPLANATDASDLRTIPSRQPRRILHKIHSGIAFLAGVKVGSLLSNKPFEAGHGSLAATNSFHIFGKSVNSAISLSYGSVGSKLPHLDDPQSNATTKSSDRPDEDVVHVTVVRNPTSDMIEKLKRVSTVTVADMGNASDASLVLSDKPEPVPLPVVTGSGTGEDEAFVREHNDLVKEFNKDLRRRNSKF